ncbi:MAG: type 2 lanthipeptide synthetase LanM family protein [Longimicrobiales bacterium]
MLGSGHEEPDIKGPEWAPAMHRIVAVATTLTVDDLTSPPLVADDPVPFQELLVPAIRVGREMLRHRLAVVSGTGAQSPSPLLADEAYHALERALLAHLATISCKTFAQEFFKRRTLGENLLADLGIPLAAGRERYARFVTDTLSDGLAGIFRDYPVLGRLVAQAVCFWVDSTAELVLRLQEDLAELTRRFATGGPLGQVVVLDATLSDRHEQGRGVVILRFENGLQLVYKPRHLAMHVGFNAVLEYCNRSGSLRPLRQLEVLPRQGYGYVEFAQNRACASQEEAAAYYERAGMLLCLLYVLRGSDCHHENLVADGDQPVLIDVETILQPRDGTGPLPDADQGVIPIEERFLDSVLRSGMLPRWQFSKDGRAYDLSALGSVTPQPVPHAVERWVDVNTDAMRAQADAVEYPVERNIPRLGGEVMTPTRFRRELRGGFLAMYDFFVNHRGELLDAAGPLEALRSVPTRFVFRDSQVYGTTQFASYAPEDLRDGIAFSLAVEPLARVFVGGRAPAHAWPLLEREIESMERQDIPLFWVASDSTALGPAGGPVVEGFFTRSGFEEVREQIRALSAADRELQAAILDGALDALEARTGAPRSTMRPEGSADPLPDEALLAEAARIGHELCDRTQEDADGGLRWLGFGYALDADRFQYQVLGDWLYDGSPGIALFLAVLYRETGERRFSEVAARALTRVRGQLASSADRARAPRPLGGAIGLGSVIYALSEVADLLGDPEMVRDAVVLAESITPMEIAADVELDVMSGAAGTVLGLASLHRVSGQPISIDLARLCADHLLEKRVGPAWPTLDSVALTGMSHGASGIAYALLRAHELTGDDRYLAAARDGIEYERECFRSAGGRWLDLRPGPGEEAGGNLVQWCHGAAGIGLARVGCARLQPSDEFEAEIDDALQTVEGFGLPELDHLCCGNMGRIETMVAVAAHRGDGALSARARAAASVLVHRARGAGYRLFGNLPRGVWNPGLFQGLAGIGYGLLRVRNPSVRSFALWE